ncbi:MAG: NusG domain II-containing protein [bacterium]
MAVILTASLYSYRLIRELSSSGEMVSIEVNNRPVARYSLKEDRRLTFKGTGGPLVCEIKNQRVRIRESSCPNKVCVKMGWKKQSGEVIACVPNKTLIYVEGKVNEKLNGVDAVSQ